MRLERGAALLTAMISLLMVTIMSILAMQSAGLEQRSANNYASVKQIYNAAEGALNNIFVTGRIDGFQTISGATNPETLVVDSDVVVNVTTTMEKVLNDTACESTGDGLNTTGQGGSNDCFFFIREVDGALANGANASLQAGFTAYRTN